MTGSGNNTYLLTSPGSGATLIDAGVGEPRHLEEIDTALRRAGVPLERVIVTHGHRDHAAGVEAIAAAHPSAVFAKHPWPAEDAQYAVQWERLNDIDAIPMGDERLVVLATPGHSPDHIAVRHERGGAIFTGDLVVAGSSVMIHSSKGGNLKQYLESLERLLALQPKVLYPAHGPTITDPKALITGYLEHRRMRELQVIAALASGHTVVETIADSIYHGLTPTLMEAARENVRAHLEKLVHERRVIADDTGWELLS